METFWSQLLAQVPVIAILLYTVKLLWDKIDEERKLAAQERAMLIDIALDTKRRTKEIEKVTTGEESPTIARRADVP